MKKYMKLVTGIMIAFCAVCLIVLGADTSASAYEAVILCGKTVIPSLFPFFVVSTAIIRGGYGGIIRKIFSRIMPGLFNISGEGSLSFFLGLISGYPIGAVTAAEMYEKGRMEKREAEELAVFCNNAGPAYVIGSVGIGLFGSFNIGLGVYIAEVLGAVTVGFIYGRLRKKTSGRSEMKRDLPVKNTAFLETLLDAVRESAGTVINVCAFIIFFAVIISILDKFRVLDSGAAALSAFFTFAELDAADAKGFLTGLLELTTGAAAMSGSLSPLKTGLLSMMVGWSGICVNMQTLAAVRNSGLSMGRFLKGKALVGIVTFFYGLAAGFIVCG